MQNEFDIKNLKVDAFTTPCPIVVKEGDSIAKIIKEMEKDYLYGVMEIVMKVIGEMIKDMGYYYPDFNAEIGSILLQKAIEDHDKSAAKYNEYNHEKLKRYTIENKKLIETYKMLLENLYEPNKHNLSHKYDWQTNTYF